MFDKNTTSSVTCFPLDFKSHLKTYIDNFIVRETTYQTITDLMEDPNVDWDSTPLDIVDYADRIYGGRVCLEEFRQLAYEYTKSKTKEKL